MPSWVWVILFLIVIALVIFLLLRFMALLPASTGERAPSAPSDPGGNFDSPLPGPGSYPRSVGGGASGRAAPPRSGAKPPPAMAGPRPNWAAADDRYETPSSAPRSPARPPAASAGGGRDDAPPSGPKRSGKPPPAQAAWSTPDEASLSNKNGKTKKS